jgi:predicted transcriptional regulator
MVLPSMNVFYKDSIITVRVTPETKSIIQSLAEEDDRTLAWMVRKLLIEALHARGLLDLKSGKESKSS